MARTVQFVATLLLSALHTLGCERDDAAAKTGGPFYYSSFETKSMPTVPIIEISEQQAKQRVSYYIAYYDQHGHVIRFEKYLQTRLSWKKEYFYDDEGRLLGGHHVDIPTGRVTPYEVDSEGRLRISGSGAPGDRQGVGGTVDSGSE